MPINSELPLLGMVAAALVVAFLVALIATPVVKSLAFKVGAVDVPKDNRRMHDHPIPRMGGLAIYLGFLLSVLLFLDLNAQLRGMLLGATIIVVLGIFDDIYALGAKLKFLIQIGAALVAVLSGNVIETLSNPNVFSSNLYWDLGWLSIPVTVLWIVAITNAVNLIDGLDGLACGPYNMNPAKIFMGDTGSTFLGYILAVVSVNGLFKFYTIISFAVPFLMLGLPIFDTCFAFIRRIAHGQSPMHADRSHVHHRLIDMGFNQKQAVAVLYIISGILGLSAVVLTTSGPVKAMLLLMALCFAGAIAGHIFLSNNRRDMEKGKASEEQPEESPEEEQK